METDPLARVEVLEREVTRLGAEVAALRMRVDAVRPPQSGRVAPTAAAPRAASAWAPPTPAGTTWSAPPMSPVRSARLPRRSSTPLDSEAMLKWGGVGLVVLAVGFAVSTAISRNWIGPELQLAGAVLVGLGLIGAGLRLRADRPGWTHALCSGGVVALFTTFASDLFLDQAPRWVALAAAMAVTAGALPLARSITSQWVAVATLTGSAVGWAVIADGEPPIAAYVAWYVLLVAAIIAVSLEQGWMASRPAGHVVGMIATLGIAGLAETPTEQILVGLAILAFAIGLVAIPSIGDLSSPWQQFEVQVAAATAPWAFAATLTSTLEARSDTVIAIGAFAIAAATVVVALAGRRHLRRAHVISLVLGASVTTSIGLAVLLSTSAAFVAIAIQGAGLVVLSRSLGGNIRVLVNAAGLIAIALIYVVVQTLRAWDDDMRLVDDIAHAAIIAAIAVAVHQSGERLIRRFGAITVLALVLVWLGSMLVHLPQGQAVVSISWATVGTGVFLIGVVRKRADAAAVGLAVIGLTVGKLLTVDLREVDTLWRAGLFFLVGVGLMRLGFLLPRLTRTDAIEHADDTTPVM